MDDSGVMIVDLGPLSDMEVIRRLRTWTQAPVIVLSGPASGLRRGGRARCPGQAGPVRIGDTVVDLRAKRITRRQQEVRLTPTEWHLLEVLLRAPGRLLSQQQLLAAVWGPGYGRAAGNLRLYMAQLRRKLEPDPSRPRWLVTEPGAAKTNRSVRSRRASSPGCLRLAALKWLDMVVPSGVGAGVELRPGVS
jgi:two-component system KDP operon response regulator KdpE